VLGIVRGHKGALKVYSELGRGTTFKALFPASDLPANTSQQHEGTAAGWHGNGTVLIVDDEETVRALASQMLERMGFRVLAAADGHEAVDLLRVNTAAIDLVLLDMTMPVMGGEEALKLLLAIRPDAPVIGSSGYSETVAKERFGGRGLAAFLQKPYSARALAECVKQVLDQYRASQAQRHA